MKMLVVDDHKGFREEVVGMLTRNGHEAGGVASALDAVSLVEKKGYDFVFVDYCMPVHDGIWFMNHVKRPRRTKVLLVTAHVNRQVIDAMFKSGASGYIIKPFDEAELLRHIEFHSKGWDKGDK